MIEEMPNGVKINNTFIPAINLQIEGFPSWQPNTGVIGATEAWYPVYFEIMFERGDLWCVTQGDNPEDPNKIRVDIHLDWAHTLNIDPDTIWFGDNWDDFLDLYASKKTGSWGY